jgi:hypothetical protein
VYPLQRREDLNKVIVQVTQNLAPRVANTHGFDVQCIWIPQTDGSAPARAPPNEINSLGRLCGEVSKAITHKVQANMAQAQADCRKVGDHVEAQLALEARKRGTKAKWLRYQVGLVWPLMLLIAAAGFLDLLGAVQSHLPAQVRSAGLTTWLLTTSAPVLSVVVELLATLGAATIQQRLLVWAGAFIVADVLSQLVSCRRSRLATRSEEQLRRLRSYQDVAEAMDKRVTDLYADYVRAAQHAEYASAAK